jgi:hypothetical protein
VTFGWVFFDPRSLFAAVSGMDRLDSARFPSVPLVDIERYLQNKTRLTLEQVHEVVDVIGAHMGDVSDVTATFQGLGSTTADRLAGTALSCPSRVQQVGAHLSFSECLAAIVKESTGDMLPVLTGNFEKVQQSGLEQTELVQGAHAVLEAFVESKGEPLDVVAVEQSTTLGQRFSLLTQVLVQEKMVVDLDGEHLGLYTPRQRHAYLALKEKPGVVDALAMAAEEQKKSQAKLMQWAGGLVVVALGVMYSRRG